MTGYMRQSAPADDEGGDPDRHVDQEDPAPTRCDQQAADDWAHGGGHAADRRPGTNGTLPALGRVANDRTHDNCTSCDARSQDWWANPSDPRLPSGMPDLKLPVAPPALYALGSRIRPVIV